MSTNTPKFTDDQEEKVMILGETGCGKSALVLRIVDKSFHGNFDPTMY